MSKAAEARRLETIPNALRRNEVLSAFDTVMAQIVYLAGDLQAISPEATHLVRSAAELLEEGRAHCERVLRPDAPN